MTGVLLLVLWTSSFSTVEASDRITLTADAVAQLEPAVAAQLIDVAARLEPILSDPSVPPERRAAAFGELGLVYHAYGLTEVAKNAYQRALELQPQSFRWSYGLAFLLEAAGELSAALAEYERALSIDPNSFEAWIHLGNVCLELNLVDRANNSFDRALALAPSSPAARAGLGQVALSRREYQRAVDHLEAVLEMVPAATRLHHPLGLAYRGLGDLEAARSHLSRRGKIGVRPPEPLLAELDSLRTGSRVHTLQGRMAFGAGDFGAAAEAFEKAVLADPESALVRVNYASALNELGRSQDAVAQLQKALEIDSSNVTAHFNLGQLALSSGQLETAADHLGIVVELSPSDRGARLALGRSLAGLGRSAEALNEIRRAIEQDPVDGGAYLAEAQVLVGLQQYRQAADGLLQAATRLPEDGRIAFALARLLAASPDSEVRDGVKALDLAQRVFRARPTAKHAEVVAQALAEQGRCEEAAQWQARVVESDQAPGSPALERRRQTLDYYLESRPCRPFQ